MASDGKDLVLKNGKCVAPASETADVQQSSMGANAIAQDNFVVLKCMVSGTDDMQRLRTKWPMNWKRFDSILSKAFGQQMAAKFEDEDGDWCTITEMSFPEFSIVATQALETLTSKTPLLKLRVYPVDLLDKTMKKAFAPVMSSKAEEVQLHLPDGVPPDPTAACGPRPFLLGLQQLSHGSIGGWTSENLCVLVLAFYPTLVQRAHRKIEKMNKSGPEFIGKIRPALEELLKGLEKRAASECTFTSFLRAILEGKRVTEFGIFVNTFAHFLHTLPVSEQKRLLEPTLAALLSVQPNIFSELFEDNHWPRSADMNPKGNLSNLPPVVELPSGMKVPKFKTLVPQQLKDQQKVHLLCLGPSKVNQNGWANLCVSAEGRVSAFGGLGLFATFKVHLKGSDSEGSEGFQKVKVALESCGGGGFLVDGGSQMKGGSDGDGCAALFYIEPLGLRGMNEEKAQAFALCMPGVEGSEGGFVGVEPNGLVVRASAGGAISKEDCGAFLMVQQGMLRPWSFAKEGLVTKEAKHAEKVAAKEAKHVEKMAAKAKQAEKIAMKAEKMNTVPVTELTQLTEGCLVHLQSEATGKRLAMCPNANVHANGGFGIWATFVLHTVKQDCDIADRLVISLESKPNVGHYLRVQPGHQGQKFAIASLDGHGKSPEESACAFELAKVVSSESDDDEKQKQKHPYFQLRPLHIEDSEDSDMDLEAFCFQMFTERLDKRDQHEVSNDWLMAGAE